MTHRPIRVLEPVALALCSLVACVVISSSPVEAQAAALRSPVAASEAAVRGAPDGATLAAAAGEPAAGSSAEVLAQPWLEESPPSLVRFDLGVVTQFPLAMGIQANLSLPFGIVLRADAGLTPSFYVDAVNSVALDMGAYDASTGAMIQNSSKEGWLLRVQAGIRPFEGVGFEVLAGYALLNVTADVSASDFEQVTGQWMPGVARVGVFGTMHGFHAQLGWSGVVFDHLVIRGALGWLHTLAADGGVKVPAELRAAADGRVEEIETDLRDGLRQYGFSPELELGIAYQF